MRLSSSLVETIGRIHSVQWHHPDPLEGVAYWSHFVASAHPHAPLATMHPEQGIRLDSPSSEQRASSSPCGFMFCPFISLLQEHLGMIYGRNNRVKPELLRARGHQPRHLGREGNLSTMVTVTWIMSHGSLGKLCPQLLRLLRPYLPFKARPCAASSPRPALQFLVRRNGGLLWAPRQPCWPTHWGCIST